MAPPPSSPPNRLASGGSGSETKTSYLNRYRKTWWNSHSVSKLIIVLAAIFFAVLFYQYKNLRPTSDIRQRLAAVVCPSGDPPIIAPGTKERVCVPPELIDAVAGAHADLMRVLEKRGLQLYCSNDNGPQKLPGNIRLTPDS